MDRGAGRVPQGCQRLSLLSPGPQRRPERNRKHHRACRRHASEHPVRVVPRRVDVQDLADEEGAPSARDPVCLAWLHRDATPGGLCHVGHRLRSCGRAPVQGKPTTVLDRRACAHPPECGIRHRVLEQSEHAGSAGSGHQVGHCRTAGQRQGSELEQLPRARESKHQRHHPSASVRGHRLRPEVFHCGPDARHQPDLRMVGIHYAQLDHVDLDEGGHRRVLLVAVSDGPCRWRAGFARSSTCRRPEICGPWW